jgi:hypothetical protein
VAKDGEERTITLCSRKALVKMPSIINIVFMKIIIGLVGNIIIEPPVKSTKHATRMHFEKHRP